MLTSPASTKISLLGLKISRSMISSSRKTFVGTNSKRYIVMSVIFELFFVFAIVCPKEEYYLLLVCLHSMVS